MKINFLNNLNYNAFSWCVWDKVSRKIDKKHRQREREKERERKRERERDIHSEGIYREKEKRRQIKIEIERDRHWKREMG